MPTPVARCLKCQVICALDEHNIPRAVATYYLNPDRSLSKVVASLGGAHCSRDGNLHNALIDLTNRAHVELWLNTH